MRVLLLAPHPFYQDRGTPIDVDLLIRALSARGEDLDLVTYHEGEERPYPNVAHHRIRAPRWLRNVGLGFSLRKLLCDLLLFFLSWKLLRQKKYDVIHAGEEAVFMAMFFKRLFRVPYVYDMDSSIAQQMVEQNGLLKPFTRFFGWCEAKAIQQSMAVAPVCNALHDLAVQRGAQHVFTLHDISQLHPQDMTLNGTMRRKLKIRGLILMYVGNLESYQGIDLLLESFSLAQGKNADINLLVAGGSQEQIKRYEVKAMLLGISQQTYFMGHWPAAKLGELLAEADILISPRIKGLNTPLKIFPFLHSGKPLLATDLLTHSQILNREIALLAPANPDAFAEAIVQLAADENMRSRLGDAGCRFVKQNHTFTAHQHRVDKLYDFIDQQIVHTGQEHA